MENESCKTCGYCKHDKTEPSPGGVMLIVNYKCANPKSPDNGRAMNSITAHGKTLDSREKNYCDEWASKHDALTDVQQSIIDAVPDKVHMTVESGVGKTKRDVTISDVDDSSSITIRGAKNNSIVLSKDKLIVDGKEVFIPRRVKNAWPNCVLQSSGELYINGFKYNSKTRTFQRTLVSWLNCVFT